MKKDQDAVLLTDLSTGKNWYYPITARAGYSPKKVHAQSRYIAVESAFDIVKNVNEFAPGDEIYVESPDKCATLSEKGEVVVDMYLWRLSQVKCLTKFPGNNLK